MTRAALLLLILTVPVGASACSSILGLERATCDPNIEGCPKLSTADDDADDDTDDDSANSDAGSQEDSGSNPPPSSGAGGAPNSDDDNPDDELDPDEMGEVDEPDDPVADEPPADDEAGSDDELTVHDAGDDTSLDASMPPADDDSPPEDPPEAGAPTIDGSTAVTREAEAPLTQDQACVQYCDLTMAACVDENEQYLSDESCMEVCLQLMQLEADRPEGSSPNTIECRTVAARNAVEAGEVQASCQQAGMSGGGYCGSGCQIYCEFLERACTGFGELPDDCLTDCAAIPRLPPGEMFGPDITDGDLLECRINHLRLATESRQPDQHCPHALGASPCAP